MNRIGLIALAMLVASTGAWAAAPGDLDSPPADDPARTAVPADYQLNIEMVVEDWVLCAGRSYAQDLVVARETSIDAAVNLYQELSASKSCGQFSELRVILQTPLDAVPTAASGKALAFEALVNLAGQWASAFVVSGTLPDR